jgi:hypothetical protein
MTAPGRTLLASAVACGLVAAIVARPSGQVAPATDRVAALNQLLAQGGRTLARDERTGYLRAVLQALDVSEESQLLVFSKTGAQRAHTSPKNPRALYFNQSVAVGYVPGAPSLEIAAHDPQQGLVFYTLDQAAGGVPAFTRQTGCLACHVTPETLGVPGAIARSHMVDRDGNVVPGEPVTTVDQSTIHTARWGGWYVTGKIFGPPYQPLGHRGNLTAMPHPTKGPVIVSDHVSIEWRNSAPETRGYLSGESDLAALLVFDHQVRAMNLLTRLNREARVPGADVSQGPLRDRVRELADYLLFVDEAALAVTTDPRPGFAAHLAASVPADSRGRSLGELDLERRVFRYPCSYMVYSDAFTALPTAVKDAVYHRLFDALSGRVAGTRHAPVPAADRLAAAEILRSTKTDLPAGLP